MTVKWRREEIQPPNSQVFGRVNSMILSMASTLHEKGFFHCVFVKRFFLNKFKKKKVYWG